MEEKVLIESKCKSGIIWVIIGIVILVAVNLIFKPWETDPYARALEFAFVDGIGLIGFFLLFFLPWFAFSKSRLTVTDKRVFGTAIFGKRVDLPLDSITAIGMSMFNGIGISTASGRIGFKLIANRDEIYNTISGLLKERQQKPAAATTIKQEIPQSNADELKKYKGLLDSGVITQEEFDAKKKQLLGL